MQRIPIVSVSHPQDLQLDLTPSRLRTVDTNYRLTPDQRGLLLKPYGEKDKEHIQELEDFCERNYTLFPQTSPSAKSVGAFCGFCLQSALGRCAVTSRIYSSSVRGADGLLRSNR